MGRKARIGFTRDYYDQDGNFILDCPGYRSLEKMPDMEREVFAEMLPEVTPLQIEDYDIVVTRTFSRWTESSFVGNDRLLSLHRNGVGYDRIDVPALNKAGVLLCISRGGHHYVYPCPQHASFHQAPANQRRAMERGGQMQRLRTDWQDAGVIGCGEHRA